MRELAKAHRSGHPGAALERVERAAELARAFGVGGPPAPRANLLTCLRKQLGGLVEEDREHVLVNFVADVRERIVRRTRKAHLVRGKWRRHHPRKWLRRGGNCDNGLRYSRRGQERRGVGRRCGHDDGSANTRFVMLIARRLALGLRLCIRERRLRIHLLTQSFELALNFGGFGRIPGSETNAVTNTTDECAQAFHRSRQDRQRGAGQRGLALLQHEQRLLKRLRGRRDQGKAAGAMDPAQRVARPHHRRGGKLPGVELQHLELVREGCEMLNRFLDEDAEQHGRKGDVTNGDLVAGGTGNLDFAYRKIVRRDIVDRDFVDGDRRAIRACLRQWRWRRLHGRRPDHVGEGCRAHFGQLDHRHRERGRRFRLGVHVRGRLRFPRHGAELHSRRGRGRCQH